MGTPVATAAASAPYQTLLRDFTAALDARQRRSEDVLELGQALLGRHAGRLGQAQELACREAVALAALDLGELEQAEAHIARLACAFPSSARVRRLQAMALEAAEDWDGALEAYAALLGADPTDAAAMKRCVCVHRARGAPDRAAALLTDYLRGPGAGDAEAWLELADLALARADLEAAAFALEEALLAAPENHHLAARYAEVLYSLGGPDNLRLARHYFALSLQLQPHGNLRALYGLHLTAAVSPASRPAGKAPAAAGEGAGAGAGGGSETWRWTSAQLQLKYRQALPARLPLVAALADALAPRP